MTGHCLDIVLCTDNRNPSKLNRTLDSLLQVNGPRCRVLLVNDSEREIESTFSCDMVDLRIINMGSRNGLTMALKKAEPLISAKYVARVDCGDQVHPDRFQKQVEYLEKNSTCVLIGVATKIRVVSQGRLASEYVTESSNSIPVLTKYLRKRNPFVHGSIMFRSEAFRRIGGYDQRAVVGQDLDLYLRIMRFGSLHILGEVLHTHDFDLSSSTTYHSNKRQIVMGLRSRLRNLHCAELLSQEFIEGLAVDAVQLVLPNLILKHLRRISWHLRGISETA